MAEELNEQQIKALKCPEAPTTQQESHPCDGTLKIECCCDPAPQLRSRTILYNAGAQPGANAVNQALAAVNALEANGWIILAHSVVETLPVAGQTAGQRYVLLTLGYYV